MENVPFALSPIAGKGQGIVAARPITKGELVLSEAPLFQQSRAISNETILKALINLSDADQRRYFSLANTWTGIHPPPLGIFKTNCLPCGDHEQDQGVQAGTAAIFLLGSRFNSSCEPNINNYWNEEQGKITFWATRDVEEGEELCICYANPLANRAARRARLQSSFHFVCECVACAREGDELRASDEARVTISRLYEEIAGCGSSPSVGVRKVKLALKLLGEEGLMGSHAASFYYDAFQFCVSVSDVRNAKAWVTKAWEAYCVERGPESSDARKMLEYKANPRAHMACGLLSKKTLVGPD